MIVPMKKITFFTQDKDIEYILHGLRKLSLLHIKHIKPPQAEGITSLEQRLSYIERALSSLKDITSPTTLKTTSHYQRFSLEGDFVNLTSNENINHLACSEIVYLAKEAVHLLQERDILRRELKEEEREKEIFDAWGVCENDLEVLKQKGIYISIYKADLKEINKLDRDKVYILKKRGKTAVFAYISYKKEETLNFERIKLSLKGLPHFARRIPSLKRREEEINSLLQSLNSYREIFEKTKIFLLKRLEFFRARFGIGEEGRIVYFCGFAPAEKIEVFKKFAQKYHLGYIIEDPTPEDDVPTLIKNPRPLRMIEPIFKFMGTLPGYWEYDVSFWFLFFLSLFFALLIGDAGYGLLFLIITLILRRKTKVPEEIFLLFSTFSITTIIWGIISGNYFGLEKIARLPFLNILVVERLNSFIDSNQNFIMLLCFLIGAVHLSIAHFMVAASRRNSLKALSQIGWVGVLWGLFFLARNLVLGEAFSQIALKIFLGGIFLIIFFSHPEKGIIKGALSTLGDIPLKIISSFSDIVSYLRLFAVGYASLIVANSFNNMAASLGFSSFVSGLGSSIILFLGHSLNIVLGFMAVIVHGVRLNMLEFSSHLDMQWSGKEYKPFSE